MCFFFTELVLKVRIANAPERDFIEIEILRDNLSLQALVNLMCEELSVDKRLVHKIRKLPNTIIRKDKDVKRLVDFQELEMVLVSRTTCMNPGSPSNISFTSYQNEKILY